MNDVPIRPAIRAEKRQKQVRSTAVLGFDALTELPPDVLPERRADTPPQIREGL